MELKAQLQAKNEELKNEVSISQEANSQMKLCQGKIISLSNEINEALQKYKPPAYDTKWGVVLNEWIDSYSDGKVEAETERELFMKHLRYSALKCNSKIYNICLNAFRNR